MNDQPEEFENDDDELIFSYSRAQALEDGVLVDVSSMAREAGFVVPVAITEALHTRLEPNENEKARGQSYEGRLWDVLWMASQAARRAGKAARMIFQVILYEEEGPKLMWHKTITLLSEIGPGDDPEPVITIGFPEDF